MQFADGDIEEDTYLSLILLDLVSLVNDTKNSRLGTIFVKVPLTEDRTGRVPETGLARDSSQEARDFNQESITSSQARSADPTPAKSRDSSHGSSGTDTETR